VVRIILHVLIRKKKAVIKRIMASLFHLAGGFRVNQSLRRYTTACVCGADTIQSMTNTRYIMSESDNKNTLSFDRRVMNV
jgi:tRNA A37 threonylcarbamoyltransferase TsaD